MPAEVSGHRGREGRRGGDVYVRRAAAAPVGTPIKASDLEIGDLVNAEPEAIFPTEENGYPELHGAELPSVDVFDSMGEVEARGLQALMSCRQSYGSAPLAATVLRAASKSQKAFEEFKTLLGQVMKRATKKNTSRGYGRKKDEAMEQYWLRIGEIPVAIQDPRLRQLRKAIDSIRACSSVGRQGEGRPWVRDNRDWFVENDCPYAPPRMTPDADELDWIGRCYKDDYGVWCIKKVEFSQQDKELAVYAYPADEEPPEDEPHENRK